MFQDLYYDEGGLKNAAYFSRDKKLFQKTFG